jgi:hypothetical protein
VSLDHGCGAHSETDVEVTADAPAVPLIDDLDPEGLELVPSGTGTDETLAGELTAGAGS